MSANKELLSEADFEALSVKKLIKWVNSQVPYIIPSADEKIMQKATITGYILLHHTLENDLKEEGISFGTRRLLIVLRDQILSKKRTREEADQTYEPDTKRPHVQEGSGDTTDTQRSLKRRNLEIAEYMKTVQSKPPLFTRLAEECKERREAIHYHFQSEFKDSDDAKTKLSCPNTLTKLPFPFLGTAIPKRFSTRGKDEARYQYMGREAFSKLVDAFMRCTETKSLTDLWVYGLMGYGKSHLLATLVYFLTAQGYRVVYLPDCRVCCQTPVRYLTQSLLFTWADKPQVVDRILNLRTMDDIELFFRDNWDISVVFVIDQMNALDGPGEHQAKVRLWLDCCRADVKTVLSTSANNLTFLHTLHKQTNNHLFTVFGGFTEAEMDAWWNHHLNVDLGEYTRAQVEDLTGRIPLLLNSCITEGVVSFDCKEVHDVERQCRRFAFRMASKLEGRELEAYQEYVRGCITGSVVPDSIDPEHVDHRYFHERNGVGYCANGIVRESVTKEIARVGTQLFSITDSIRSMMQFISNACVVGYFLERAILQSVTSAGIGCLDILGPMPQITFDAHPTYNMKHAYALYVPKAFNYPAIDALIMHIDKTKMKAHLLPMQVTIAKTHSNSEDHFFRDWSHWIRGLEDYEVSLTFLWVTVDETYSKKKIEARYRKSRGTLEMLVRPTYFSANIPLKEINGEVWRKYQHAKNELLSN